LRHLLIAVILSVRLLTYSFIRFNLCRNKMPKKLVDNITKERFGHLKKVNKPTRFFITMWFYTSSFDLTTNIKLGVIFCKDVLLLGWDSRKKKDSSQKFDSKTVIT